MIPTFLQKRRTSVSSLRIGFTLAGLVILLIGCSLAISFIIADRALTKTGKLCFIAALSVSTLLGSGLFERFKRH